ncbi:hypothetical protein N3K66_008289 [Trichothecium roseum]|uniref:Uncharacterized protein n=1 Tax=Trichothecium roseum TaxID=47278 RepID=A0ACC0UUT7_9HYPO|nr:hypothetical protein N3K66_008289 [Trichothecium roseum]
MSQTFSSPPPPVPSVLVTSPAPHVLLVTLDRPAQLNALRRESHYQLADLWRWYDAEPSLRCAVVTGRGPRAFCAGADLKEWDERNSGSSPAQVKQEVWSEAGFGGLSNRRGKKPVVAAVNGLCLGGGMEMVLNVDMVVADAGAKFGLPEVKRGVVAIAGALPRLPRIVGRARASEMALTGRMYTAAQMESWGIVNRVVGGEEGATRSVVDEAVALAAEVAANSPDSVIVSREGLLGAWEGESARDSTERVDKGIYRGILGGDNMKEGVLSFVEKRAPVWKDSKL